MDSNDLAETQNPPRQPTPVLSLRDVVVFPHMVIPLFVGRERSVRALEETMNFDKQILLITQKNPEVESPDPEDLFSCGTIASILQMLRLPDGTTKVLVEGVERVRIDSLEETEGYLSGTWQRLESSG
ncbi:MAG: LON peptidase substrate-binding domain-containing protein, partial [Wenzhouxiangella sp.]